MKTKDEEKTREQLIDELAELRKRLLNCRYLNLSKIWYWQRWGRVNLTQPAVSRSLLRGEEILKESKEFDELLIKL
jgi:hypothetical protein